MNDFNILIGELETIKNKLFEIRNERMNSIENSTLEGEIKFSEQMKVSSLNEILDNIEASIFELQSI